MRECQLLLLGDIEAICRKQRQKGHRELQSGAAGGEKNQNKLKNTETR